jgi:hypothetical protein
VADLSKGLLNAHGGSAGTPSLGSRWFGMRLVTTLLYGFAVSLALLVAAANLIGQPRPGEIRQGGLTAATVLSSDGSKMGSVGAAAPQAASPSS